MNSRAQKRAIVVVGALSLASASWGCVSDRPSRNGVFDENQYVRKAFLVRPGDGAPGPDGKPTPDQGWFLKATVTDASAPNVFGEVSIFGLYPGAHSSGHIVHFNVTSNKLQMVNMREVNSAATVGGQSEIINAWPITNVDLKYRINLDGEKTNFYEENQELDWQSRQWIKVNLDKNDMSDLAPLGAYYNANIAKCADLSAASATLVPNSFHVDEPHNYMEWAVQVTLPIKFSDRDCVEAFGSQGQVAQRLGREYETVTLKYSLERNQPSTYAPMALTEKDNIRRKYGVSTFTTVNRDPDSGLLAASEYVIRYDPNSEIKWYFEKGFPDNFKNIFTSKGLPKGVLPLPAGQATIEDATNQVLTDSGAKARVSFHEYNEALEDGSATERSFGDIRYNIVRWLNSLDQQSYFAGVESGVVSPRSGQVRSNDIVINNFAIKDYYVTRIDAYLQTIGASPGGLFSQTPWPDQPTVPDPNDPTKNLPIKCTEGASIPIVPSTLAINHNGLSTLFQKMQGYLYQPVAQFGALGPRDFIMDHSNDKDDFNNAYFALVPYLTYADPETNQFVIPDGSDINRGGSSMLWQMIAKERQFHDLSAAIDHGQNVFDVTSPNGAKDAANFLNTYKDLSINHRNLRYAKTTMRFAPNLGMSASHADRVTDFSLDQVMQKDARHCVKQADGSLKWESKEDWINSLVQSYWSQVFWHEFGHALGLEHNFMGSVDKPNFQVVGKNADGTNHYALYSSSVMEYNASPDRVFWTAGWGAYDKGAIGFIYGNASGKKQDVPPGAVAKGISGQISATVPWNDPKGFDSKGNEVQFLYCNERHTKYTPLCRAGDIGTTPSEITANEIDAYEWQYKWRNFRQYRKIWDDSHYGDAPLDFVTELRRFISLWAFDMSPSELTNNFIKIGVKPPSGAPSSPAYFTQLSDKFNEEMSHAGSMVAAFHEAIIQQSSGQRPYLTLFDNYFGDVTQQGIAIDKLDALQSWLALWPVDNYDQNQGAGAYISSFAPFGFSTNINGTGNGSFYETVAEQAADSMIGGSYDAFAYFKPLGVAQFQIDTHSINFTNAIAGASRAEVRDWAGGRVFSRLQDFLEYFHDLAFRFGYKDAPNGIDCRASVASCNYDPRTPRAYQQDIHFSDPYNEFLGPDGRRYIWVYIQDRNQWVIADRDRNSATYTILRNYTTDVVLQKDDGNYGGPAFTLELQVKYFIDYYYDANKYTP